MSRFSQIMETLLKHRGMSVSAFMHLCLFILLILNFPHCTHKRTPEIIISVDLLPISQMTNVENKQNKPQPKPEEKVIDKPKPVAKPIEEEAEPEKKPEPKPEPVKDAVKEKKIEEKKEKPKPKASAKKDEPKKKKKPKPKVDEYEQMLKDLTESAKNTTEPEEKVEKSSKGPHNEHMPLSISLRDSIKKQIEQCWSPPVGNKDAAKMQVLIDINFKIDGSVASAKVSDTSRYSSDDNYKVAADSAVRAIHKCSPLQGLPAQEYSSWENIEFNFDPSEMVY